MKLKKTLASIVAMCSLIVGKVSAGGINKIEKLKDGSKSIHVSIEHLPELVRLLENKNSFYKGLQDMKLSHEINKVYKLMTMGVGALATTVGSTLCIDVKKTEETGKLKVKSKKALAGTLVGGTLSTTAIAFAPELFNTIVDSLPTYLVR